MRFLIDAHLPPRIVHLLNDAGHDALHASTLPDGNQTTDHEINRVSMSESRVVVSKDIDFFNSLVLQSQPWKLVLIRTGNISTRDLCSLLESRLLEMVEALEQNSLVELTRTELQVSH